MAVVLPQHGKPVSRILAELEDITVKSFGPHTTATTNNTQQGNPVSLSFTNLCIAGIWLFMQESL